MSKTYNCSFRNMCDDSEKRYLCCYYCDTKKCKYRCKDSVKTCQYKLKEGNYPPSATVQGIIKK